MSGQDHEYEYERMIRLEKNNVLGLVITTEIWIVFYNCFNAWFYQSPFNGKILIENMLFIRPTDMSYMWYMPVIIGIYLFIPFVVNGMNHTNAKSLLIPLSVTFFVLFVIPIVDVFYWQMDILNFHRYLILVSQMGHMDFVLYWAA